MRKFILLLPIIFLLISPVFNIYFFNLSWGEFLSIILWYFFFLVAGLIFYPLMALIFPRLPDSAYGLSKVVSFILIGYISWILPYFGIVKFSFWGMILTYFILSLSMLIFSWKYYRFSLFTLFKSKQEHIVVVESLFVFIFFLFLINVSFHPNIWASEKHMDFSILNYLIRRDRFPINDPWYAGFTMKYYYLGYYFFAGLVKVIKMPTAIGYHLSMATLPALMAISAYSMFRWILKRTSLAIFGSLAVVLFSNLQACYNFLIENKSIDFAFFWSSSRVFIKSFFAEYPSWSFLFADLHPHVMAYPITICLLVFLYDYITQKKIYRCRDKIIFFAPFSLLWGSLIGINIWDFIIFGIVFGILLFIRITAKGSGNKQIKYLLLSSILIFLGAIILFSPFLWSLTNGHAVQFDIVRNDFNLLKHLFAHEGHWWILLFLLGTFFISHIIHKKYYQYIQWEWNYLLIIVPVLLGTIISFIGIQGLAWSVLAFCTLLLLFFYLIFQGSRQILSLQIFFYCGTVGTILMLLSTHFIFMNRFDSIFKVFNNIWIFYAISFLSLSRYLMFFFKKSIKNVGRIVFLPQQIMIVLILISFVLLLIGSIFNFFALKQSYLAYRPQRTLKGDQYLKQGREKDYKIIEWIRNNVSGTPTILAYSGKSYDYQTPMITMHTGIPAYLAWPGRHSGHRGIPSEVVIKRIREIEFIYKSNDIFKVYTLLTKNNIKLIYIGDQERRQFGQHGLEKFSKNQKYFRLLTNYQNASLYAVQY